MESWRNSVVFFVLSNSTSDNVWLKLQEIFLVEKKKVAEKKIIVAGGTKHTCDCADLMENKAIASNSFAVLIWTWNKLGDLIYIKSFKGKCANTSKRRKQKW